MVPTDREVVQVVEAHLRAVLGESWGRTHSLEIARQLHLTRASATSGGGKETRQAMQSRPLVRHIGRSRAEKMLAAVADLCPLWRVMLELLGAGYSRRAAGKVMKLKNDHAAATIAREALAAARMFLHSGA